MRRFVKTAATLAVIVGVAGYAFALSLTMRLAPGNTCPSQVQTFNEGTLTPDASCQISVTNDQDAQRLLRQGWVITSLPQLSAPLQMAPAVAVAALPTCAAGIAGSYAEVNNNVACVAGATPVATASAGVECGVHCGGSSWKVIP